MTIKKHIVGNWKMNHKLSDIEDFFNVLDESNLEKNVEAWIAPQSLHIPRLLALGKDAIKVGGQNSCTSDEGAFTGELSPSSLKDIGAHFVIIAHSERRTIYNESASEINQKIKTALEADLQVIYCVGETLEEREQGITENVIAKQIESELTDLPSDKLQNIILAYEPVWAIGTGVTASPEQAQEMHEHIRKHFTQHYSEAAAQEIIILYGGSVKPGNAAEIFGKPDVDGGLIGGASLKADDFAAIINA